MILRNSYLIYPLEFQKDNKVKNLYNPHTRRVAFLGSIRRSKGIEDLMRASAMCTPKWDVVAIGTVSKRYMESLRRLAFLLKINLEITEFSTRPYDLLEGRASLIAVPSKWPEPFGRIPFESVSNGFPVVLSNAGGLPEVNQFFSTPQPTFPSGNIQELHRTLQSLNQDQLSILHKTEVRLAPIVEL
jgi:glycosyltransferase involved in cell wall biosynthesis